MIHASRGCDRSVLCCRVVHLINVLVYVCLCMLCKCVAMCVIVIVIPHVLGSEVRSKAQQHVNNHRLPVPGLPSNQNRDKRHWHELRSAAIWPPVCCNGLAEQLLISFSLSCSLTYTRSRITEILWQCICQTCCHFSGATLFPMGF